MAQEQQQEPSAKEPLLLTRVFGSRIAQAIGIFGVAFTLFQGLEPFLKFSRFMAYLVDHWRDWTRGLWSWLASFVHLDLPPLVLDLMTVAVFITLFTIRCFRHREAALQTFDNSGIGKMLYKRMGHLTLRNLSRKMVHLAAIRYQRSFVFRSVLLIVAFTSVGVIPFAIFLAIYPHAHLLVSVFVSFVLTALYIVLAACVNAVRRGFVHNIVLNNMRSIFIFIGLLIINYIALYSNAIDAFIKRATQ